MRLIYDRGTIVIEGDTSALDLGQVAGMTWDPRVAKYRLPGARYQELLTAFSKKAIPVADEVCRDRLIVGKWQPPALRPYQDAALSAWQHAGQRGIVVLPTGSGKTRVAIAAMALTGLSTLCIVPTRVLLEQWHKQISEYYGSQVGIYGDGDRTLAPITVATFESAYRNAAQLGNRFGLIVADEVHHFANGARSEIFELSTASSRLGLSATIGPETGDFSPLTKLIGSIVYELNISDLAGTFLANFDAYSMHVDLNSEERAAYDTHIALYRKHLTIFKRVCPEASWADFARHAARTTEGRAALVALRLARKLIAFPSAKQRTFSSLIDRHRQNRVLIFTSDTGTAYQIAKTHLVMPLTAEIKRKERDEMLAKFREGRINALVSCRVLNEGLDVPDADVAIILGGALGLREHIQRIGRLLRPSPGKRALVYELVCRRTLEVRQWQRRNASDDS